MEIRDEVGGPRRLAVPFPARLGGAALTGALLAALLMVAAGWAMHFAHLDHAASAFAAYLARGGWVWIPLWGAAADVAAAWRDAKRPAHRVAVVALAAVLALLPLAWRPVVVDFAERVEHPSTPRDKATAILRWAYRDPSSVARILPYASDADPIVREQAVLALGRNWVTSAIENRSDAHADQLLASPIRDSLRMRLLAALTDPVLDVRVEAARALWLAPRTFGAWPAAAETLAVALDHQTSLAPAGRAAWLALDASAGPADSSLRAAVVRFAQAARDTDVRIVAGDAVRRWTAPPGTVPQFATPSLSIPGLRYK
ncbi:MAG TPA: hypothetical protein VL332_05560 [Candidatus Saccharimonadaceae bacterium]|nr:hypothetical protein [Candidatus Saccharimonadaceae bacterium]